MELEQPPLRVYSFQADYQSNFKAPTPLQIEGEQKAMGAASAGEALTETIDQAPRSLPKTSQPGPANQQMKRLSLQLSASLHREAKLAALEDEETLNSMVIGLLKQYLAQRRKMIQSTQQRHN